MQGLISIEQLNIAIVDYQLGNLFSVRHACEKIGCSPLVTSKPEDIIHADAIILPGVGAFKAAMNYLQQSGIEVALAEIVKSGKPLMGVCLGMQLLFESSEEFEYSRGLSFLPGAVKKFNFDGKVDAKVPQIAWNQIRKVRPEDQWEMDVLSGIRQNEFMYFVHSFYVIPEKAQHILTITTYHDINYCSSVLHENIFATQFHPEKSGQRGLLIYQNWLNSLIKH